MNNKKRIVIIVIIILLLLCICASVIGILEIPDKNKEKPKEPEEPKITEDFKEAELVSKLISEGTIYYDDKTKDINEYINEKTYTIGNNGKLFADKILISDDNEANEDMPLATSKNYEFYTNDSDYCYYINTKTKKKSKDYDDIILPYKNKLYGIYAILVTYNEKSDTNAYEVLNTNDGTISKLDIASSIIDTNSSIKYKDMYDENEDSLNYFKINNATNKTGVIDHKGNLIIDIIYDTIEIFEDKYIIASINNKYGIIDFKNNEIIPFEYDLIFSIDNYIILRKNNKISIANDKAKIYIDNKIDIENENNTTVEEGYNYFYSTTYNNKLYLRVYYKGKTSIYLINSKDIERKISTTTNFVSLNDKYIYTFEQNNDKETLTFYDYDLYEYYKTEFDRPKDIKSQFLINDVEGTNEYYRVLLSTELEEYDKTYYIDLFNSKQIDEYTATKKFFPNGYNFYISIENKLYVYKNTTLLNEFEGYYEYLGGYLFLKDSNEIVEIIFKKDSTS